MQLQGLTPELFWQHRDELLSADQDDIESLVIELVSRRSVDAHAEWSTLPTPIEKVSGQLAISRVGDLPSRLPLSLPNTPEDAGYVLISDHPQASFAVCEEDAGEAGSRVLFLSHPEGKKGQLQFLGSVLPEALAFINDRLDHCFTHQYCAKYLLGALHNAGPARLAFGVIFHVLDSVCNFSYFNLVFISTP